LVLKEFGMKQMKRDLKMNRKRRIKNGENHGRNF
jgi:hypothetical protein